MSHLSRWLLPTALIAAVTCCSERSRAQTSGRDYALAGYQHIKQQCSLFFDVLIAWKDAPVAYRPAIVQRGAAIADRLAALATPNPPGHMPQRTHPGDANTIEAFERLASTKDLQGKRDLLFSVLRQAKDARPPQAILDMRDAQAKINDYAAYCTFAGIASLQTRITR